MKTLAVLAALLVSTTALAYLPPKDVRVELVEFKAEGKTLQGAFFAPDPARACA
jgi:hypothetical protein